MDFPFLWEKKCMLPSSHLYHYSPSNPWCRSLKCEQTGYVFSFISEVWRLLRHVWQWHVKSSSQWRDKTVPRLWCFLTKRASFHLVLPHDWTCMAHVSRAIDRTQRSLSMVLDFVHAFHQWTDVTPYLTAEPSRGKPPCQWTKEATVKDSWWHWQGPIWW